MSRAAGGTYSLPAGNPVVSGTTISSTWANNTLSDIATAMTDSLSRSGLGGMLAALKAYDGVAATPGIGFDNETSTGWYRSAANDVRMVVAATELLQYTTNLLRISGTAPAFRFNETDAAANNKLWDIVASSEALSFRALLDNLTATTFLQVDRTAGTIDTVNFSNGTLQYGGNEVGFRSLISRTISASDNTAASDNGRLVRYNGTGGHTFTVDSDFGVADYLVTIVNSGSASLAIAESLAGDLSWYNGSGTISTGSRTLAVGGIATIWMATSSVPYIWGTGLS